MILKTCRRQKKYTRQIMLYMSAAVTIIALISFLELRTYQDKTEKIFADITNNLDFAAFYGNMGRIREAVESYLQKGDSTEFEESDAFWMHMEEQMGENYEVFIGHAADTAEAVWRKNLVGIYENFIRVSKKTVYAKAAGDMDAYLDNYEQMLDIYAQMDLYVKEITSRQLLEKAQQYEAIQVQMSKNYWLAVAVVLSITVFVVFLILSLSAQMTRPILRLSEYVKRIENGDFDFELEKETSSEEVQTLYHSVDHMKNTIREKQGLERMLNEQKIDNLKMGNALQEAQLRALQAQVDPHFLFNTINIGAQMATLHDDDEVADYFYHVSELFRYNISGFDQGATLQEEIDHTLNYVNLMDVRFGGKYRFDYNRKVEGEYLNIRMPKLILQPIVENAYVHGVRKCETEGNIKLTVLQQERQIIVSVKNNGPQMTEEKIAELLSGVLKYSKNPDGKGNGVGMGNVIERMRLWFKREDVMRISSGDGVTEILLLLPMDKR